MALRIKSTPKILASSYGYTIAEVMIFLAVSSPMFVMAMAFVSGQQNRAQFVTNARDLESQLADIANNVATGYYQRPANFSCTYTGSYNFQPLASSDSSQGTNNDCVYVGTVVKFGQGGEQDDFLQFAMAGLRTTPTGPPTSLAAARPTAIYNASNLTNTVTTEKHGYGAWVECVATGSEPCLRGSSKSAIGFFNSYTNANSNSGSGLRTDIVVYNAAAFTDSIDQTVAVLNDVSNNTVINPEGGVRICLRSGVTNQYALIRIGGSSQLAGVSTNSTAITTEIKGGDTCA